MSRFHGLRRLGALAAAVILLGVFAGCSQGPVAPPPSEQAPPVLVIEPDGSVRFKQPEPLMPQGNDLEAGSASLRVSRTIDGAKGGWMNCGRMFLIVPPGAYDSLGTITMSMKDSTALVVDLEIAPASLNGFERPVILAANTTGVNVSSDSLSMYWYDPGRRAWVPMSTERTMSGANESAGEVDDDDDHRDCTGSQGLWTLLDHFSVYSTGKAGW